MAIFSRSLISSKAWLAALVAAACLAPAAQASTMPAADRLRSGVSLASGPALGAEWSPAPRWLVGVSAGAPWFFWQDFGTLRYGAHAMVQLLELDGFFMAGVGGLYGDLYFGDLGRYSPIGLQLGAALAYQLNSHLTLRLNLVPGVSLRVPPSGWVVFPPAGGAEISWRWSESFETTIGYNGNGDILGLNWNF